MGDGSRELLGSDWRVLDVSVLWKLMIIKEAGVEGIQAADKLADTRLDMVFSLFELSHTHATKVLALPLADGASLGARCIISIFRLKSMVPPNPSGSLSHGLWNTSSGSTAPRR